MSDFTVLYDACVLYPAPLRDLLMQLALTDLYRAKWSERIHQEWIRNVLKNRPELSPQALEQTKNLMNGAILDCLVEYYEEVANSLNLPDPNDNHVLAAAIVSGCNIILTFNIKDFPVSWWVETSVTWTYQELLQWFIEACWHPQTSNHALALQQLQLKKLCTAGSDSPAWAA